MELPKTKSRKPKHKHRSNFIQQIKLTQYAAGNRHLTHTDPNGNRTGNSHS